MSARLALALTLAAFLVIGNARSEAEPGPRPGLPPGEVDQALRTREYARAVELIDQQLGAARDAAREALLFRRGLALLYAGKPEAAIAQFDAQLQEFPSGAWAQKALFRKADAHAELRQYDAAEVIYAERVRQLVGEERKGRIAQVYLEIAQEFREPQDTLIKPNYAKAASFYGKALALEPGDKLKDDIMYRQAWCRQKLDEWATAGAFYEQYLLVFDAAFREAHKLRQSGTALPAPAAVAGEHAAEARLGLAECRLATGQHIDARRVVQDLLKTLGEDIRAAEPSAVSDDAGKEEKEPFRPLTRRELWIKATYLLAQTYRMPAPPDAESLTLGVQVLQRLLEKCPESKEAIQAAADIAAGYAARSRYDEAIKAYRALIDRERIRPGDEDAAKLAETLSQSALFKIGELFFAQKKYADAIGAWNQYAAKYPTGPQWSAAQQAIVDAEYQVGADAVVDERFDEVRTAWAVFLQKYPLDRRAAEIMYQLGALSYQEQERREKTGEATDWQEPIIQWRKTVSKFPKTVESGHAQFMIGLTLEEKTKDLEAAIEEYRKLTWSDWANSAHAQLAALRGPTLRLLTERTFRTDEPARVRVDLRNIDKLIVKLYRIDLEEYYRKSHGIRGVEGLDLLLIDPDKTLEVPVEGYAKYKPITQRIDIPFDGPGVWAVNVSTETASEPAPDIAAPRLEATTLLIRSDIDLIVKTSRRQVLVFAENMRTQTPAANVRVLVSDGKKIVLEGQTGDDGVWSQRSDELKNMEALSTFAALDGHVAGDALSMSGLGFSTGLQPRGYIYTDRPTYQPGQAVNIRGVLREIKDGQYDLPTQPEDERLRWKLDVVDAKGRVLRTEPLTFTDYGSFAAQFRVAGDAPVGNYQLIARRPDGPTFTGVFAVQTYQLPKAMLRCDFKERVVLRGQPITGSIVAQYNYGEPVIGKIVEYEAYLPTGDVIKRRGVTDQEGKVAFEFDSTLLPEEGVVHISARQADLDILTVSNMFVAVRAFTARVTTPRPLYLSEEPVEATIETRDLLDKPLAQAMTLTALLRTENRGQWAETKVESVEVKTDAEKGVGRASLKLIKGGTYVLRAEGRDQLDHVVTAETTVQVSDDKDATKLRLFTERQNYKVGETIKLDLHSRVEKEPEAGDLSVNRETEKTAAPTERVQDAGATTPEEYLALVTCVGDEVISYQTLRFRKGHNAMELPVGNEHFPNFAVEIAAMAGGRFHTATRDFTVERQLSVTLTPDRATYRPRDEMTVRVQVTDHQGQPVKAEIGLVMVDQALLARFPDQTPDIMRFFQSGAYRTAVMRTQTSCTFGYQARTREMVTEVLAEARRLEEQVVALGSVLRSEDSVIWLDQRNDAAAVDAQQSRLEYNRILSSGSKEDIKAMRDVLASVDAGGLASGGERSENLSVTLRSLSAEKAKDLVEQLQQRAGGQAGRPPAPPPAAAAPSELAASDGTEFHDADARERQGLSLGYQHQHGDRGQSEDRLFLGRQLQQQVDEVNARYGWSAGVFGVEGLGQRVAELIQSASPRTYFPEVAYWNPRVETDANGQATVAITLPDSSTKWKLVARGVTVETLCGGGEAEVLCKHDFVTDLVTPSSLVEGDSFQPRAQVHCLVPYTGKIDVTLKYAAPQGSATMTVAGAAGPTEVPALMQTRTVDTTGAGVYDVEFEPITVPAGQTLRLEVTATTQTEAPDAKRILADAASRAIPVRPWGLRLEAHDSGVLTDSDFVEIELPPPPADAGEYHDRQLTIAVGPSRQRWLVEEAMEAGPRWAYIEKQLGCWRVVPPRTHADTASSLLGALYAADYLRAQQGDSTGKMPVPPPQGTADLRLLSERAAGLIAQLLAAQNDDGGWPWCGKADSDPWVTAHVAWALGKARGSGSPVADQAVEKLLAYLRKQFADAKTAQTELKAVTLHGISWLEEADFGHANRLYRNRQTLSNAALGHLALTFTRLDRKSIAGELLGLLNERMKEVRRGERIGRLVPNTGNSCWMNSELEVTALALLAQLAVDAKAANVQPMVDYLVGSARADGWRPHKARGAILAALATYYGRAQHEGENYTLAIAVNGRPIRELTADDAGSVRIDLADADLAPGKQRVDFAFAGRGECAYAVTLSGFSRHFPKPETTHNNVVNCQDRRIAPPLLEYKGRVVPVGFSFAEEFKEFFNEVKNVSVAGVVEVKVPLWRQNKSNNEAGDRDYIVVQETIPAGFRLLTDTISGAHQAYDYADGILTLYFGSRQHLSTVQYRMVATTPGTYRLPPTIIRSLYRPEIMRINSFERLLRVLPRDTASPDERRLTPDEFYTLGRWNFDDGDYGAAAENLKGLLAGGWGLREEPYRESLRMLLETALAHNDADEIVNYFEILKEKYADLVIPFEKIVRVADAYGRTKQHERAYLIYRATADASFIRDSNVGGVLQQERRFLESIDYLRGLWREYPDTPQVENVYYAISQTLYAKANQADTIQARRGAPAAEKTRVTRLDIVKETIRLLESFLALYPENPSADEASYSLANAYLELGDFPTVLARTGEMIRLFPESKWLDRFRYVQALAHFNLGDFAKALELAHAVSESTYRDEQGVVRASPNKWLALYIIGQIYHAQQQTARAVEFYKQVKEQFSDAQEAVSYFEHKFVELPEVAVFHPDQGGFREAAEWAEHLRAGAAGASPRRGAAPLHPRPYVDISYRNIKGVVLQVYRVDLMKLALVEKNLSRITAVNLAGIKPIFEKAAPLGDGCDYIDKSVRIELDVLPTAAAADPKGGASAPTADGAYLVICRGDDLFSSGLVLVTPIALEVQEDTASQRTRVTVVNAIDRGGLKNVHVKMIGTGMTQFITGETDLRGMYAGDGVRGFPTVIARDAAGHFAFHRSPGTLLAMAPSEPPAAQKPGQPPAKADYLWNVTNDNRAIQAGNEAFLNEMMKQQQKGVEVQKAQEAAPAPRSKGK